MTSTSASVLIIFVLIVLINNATLTEGVHVPFILCPLGDESVELERDDATETWSVVRDPTTLATTTTTTVSGKPCWCVTLGDQYPAFCPNQFDTCRIEEGIRVTCINLEGQREDSGVSWLLPFVGPFAILMYTGLLLSCCFSRRGLACRDYFFINVVSCCGRNRARYEHWMELSLHRNTTRFRGWSRYLLEMGVARERDRLRAQGEPDPWMLPTRLELKTRIYRTAEIPHDLETLCGAAVDLEASCPSSPLSGIQEIDNDSGNCQLDEKNFASSCQEVARSFSESDDDGVMCAICCSNIDEGDRIGSIPCNHLFHVECLKEWLKKKNECPLCSARSIANPKA